MPTTVFGQDDEVVAESFGENDELVESFGQDDEVVSTPLERAGNAAAAFAQGLTTATGQSISGAARAADTIKEGIGLTSQTVGPEKPTMRQGRRAFEQAMSDPGYLPALTAAGDDAQALAKAESLFGPGAKLDRIRTPIDEWNKAAGQESIAQQKQLEQDSPTYQFGQGVTAAGKELYPTDPTLDAKPESKIARALGGTLPTVATGLVPGVGVPAAVSQYALSQSEDMAQEAIDAGKPELATQAATVGLFIGALSEATLGATARLKSIMRNPTRMAALEQWAKANPKQATALVIATREGAQEGIEQIMQNVAASDVVGYDPERPWSQNVLEAAGLGFATGGLIGGGSALMVRPRGRDAAVSDNPEIAQGEAELNAALADFNAPERITELAPAAPVIEGTQGELIPLPPAEERLTGEQRMAREAVAAMAELRAMKAAAKQQPEVKVEPQVLIPAEPVKESLQERPAPTIEVPKVSPAESRVQSVSAPEAQAPEAAGPAEPTVKDSLTVTPPPRRRQFRLGPRPDGMFDVLDAIQEAGGIKAPGSQQGTAEYDGYAAAFNSGPAAVLRGGANRPDLLLEQLRAQGFSYETTQDLYDSVQRAGMERDRLRQEMSDAARVRPENVERVQAIYDAAVAGQPITPEALMELESTLNQRELKTLAKPLRELQSLAGVAPQEVAEPTPVQQAKAELRQAWADLQQMGIMADPKRDAEKAFALYKALFKLATAYAKQGMRSAAEFAAKLNLKPSAILNAAWEDARKGTAKTKAQDLDAADVAELAEGFKTRQFSERFAEDERIDPAIREATGNQTYQAIPNAVTVEQALEAIKTHGIDAATALMKDEQNPLTSRERVTIGQAIIAKLNHAYAATQNEAALDQAVDVAEWLTEYGTKLGQGVQAFAIWNRLTPEGYVQAYTKAVKKSHKMGRTPPEASPDAKRKIHKMAADALRKPPGFQQDNAIVDVLSEIARAKGVSKMDIALALWYANILSGWTTQVRNMAGNLSNLFAESFAHAAVRPQHLPSVLAGLYNGMIRGGIEAGGILRTGKVTGTRVGKVEPPPALELIRFKGLAYPLNAWKYVFRVMAATDMVAFRSAEEMRMRFLAREIVRKEKLSGNALAARLADLLHNTPSQRAAAEAQATREGLTGATRMRRVLEIMEQARPESLVAEAADYGRFATYNQDPEGVLGVIAQGINAISHKFPPMRLVVPFTRVVANVTNNALNFTPWGYRRLFPSAFMDENWMKEDAVPLDYQMQAARATLGTLALGTLYALAVNYRDDDDPPFMLTANGPQDPDHRKQLRETGWEPYTVKIGDRYWSYRETPLHLIMATLGSLLDASRYKKLDEADALTRYSYALRQIGTAPLNQSFLRSLSEFFEGLSDDRVPKSGHRFAGLSRTASGILVPNLAKQVDKLFDPTIYDAGTVQGALLRDLPIARRGLEPAVNVLGETIKADQNPFYSLERTDPLWTVIGRRRLWIPTPNRTMMIGNRPITPEEYHALVKLRGELLAKQLRKPETMRILETKSEEMAQRYVSAYAQAATTQAKAKLKLRPAPPQP